LCDVYLESSTNDEDREKNRGVAGPIMETRVPSDNSPASNKGRTKKEDKKGGTDPSKVLIENKTEKVLVLREKMRGAYLPVR
jgi:hypothetical protein